MAPGVIVTHEGYRIHSVHEVIRRNMRANLLSWGFILAVVSCENRASCPKSAGSRAGKAVEVTEEHISIGPPPIHATISDQTEARVIEDYVTKSRSWGRNEYRIEERGPEGSEVLYWVVHVDDDKQKARMTGGGKSFAVLYDPHREEVVEELAFQ